MDLSNQNHDSNPGRIIPLALIGVGLIILGVVAYCLLSNPSANKEYSVVPSAVNFPAPAITLNDLDGRSISLTDYTKQIVLVNNWATWCPPCKSEMPTMQDYYKEHVNEGFILVGIEAGDTKEQVASFVKEHAITFPILLDPNNISLIAFHNESLPSSYVIDRSGTVVLAWTGPISHAMLEKYLTPLLEQ
jgi:peroxiredoxin